MTSILIRIALRWLAGGLVMHGWLSADMAGVLDDPDIVSGVEIGAGLAAGALAEGWYYLARKSGGPT